MLESEQLRQTIEEIVGEVVEEKLREVIRQEISSAMSDVTHTCRFRMSDDEAEAMTKYVKHISKLGGDKDIDSGLDIIRANHMWISGLRKGGARAGAAFLLLLVTGAAGAFLAALWETLRRKIIEG